MKFGTFGSAQTLFRWGGKYLHHFAANLFRKRCTEFYQNRPSFIEDITKKTFSSLFPVIKNGRQIWGAEMYRHFQFVF